MCQYDSVVSSSKINEHLQSFLIKLKSYNDYQEVNTCSSHRSQEKRRVYVHLKLGKYKTSAFVLELRHMSYIYAHDKIV